MDPFKYPTQEGGAEVAKLLGVDAQRLMSCQDWEYTFPDLGDIAWYRDLYELPETSSLAKRVLGCFIFQCMEEHAAEAGSTEEVEGNLARLAKDYHIHRHEFEYWSQIGDEYYTEHPEEGFRIMATVRKVMRQREKASSD